jgi:hypothetical protein
MFGIKKLERRIETLERDYRKRLCDAGSHEWMMKTSDYGSEIFIGCKHCYAKKGEKKS